MVTALEGEPLPSGDIASRLGGFDDVAAIEAANAGGSSVTTDAELIDLLLGSKNTLHNNYQDFQAFLDAGGKIGLQHDPLLYGAYLLNPFLVRVDLVPMLVVNQGEVAVIKGFVGLPTADTSGAEFKFGSIVRPGHRGIWQEPLRTGKYAINPRVYAAEIVPTFILTLNWADATSEAHDLDAQLSSIVGKSREGFVFQIDLQVQIHVPDTKAPKVISMVGTMRNLVSEVLQSAVGNHFRNTLQALEAVKFIETRREVQAAAFEAITRYLGQYEVETKGVYIQDVVFPARAGARAHPARDRQPGEGDVRGAAARRDVAHRDGEGEGHRQHAGAARAARRWACRSRRTRPRPARRRPRARRPTCSSPVRRRPRGARPSVSPRPRPPRRSGSPARPASRPRRRRSAAAATAVVAVANAVADGHITVVPEVLVTGGGGGGSLDGLAATLMRYLGTGRRTGNGKAPPPPAVGPAGRRAGRAGRRCPPTSKRRGSPRGEPARRHRRRRRSRRDVVEQLASVVGRERDVARVERDAVEVLVAQHVAVVQPVGEDPAEREAELAQAVAVALRARIGERQVDVHAVGRRASAYVARGEHGRRAGRRRRCAR